MKDFFFALPSCANTPLLKAHENSVLICSEATSALDTGTERDILESLEVKSASN